MKAKDKFRKIMGEFKRGELHHGTTGKVVKDRDMALAIAFSEARKIYPSFGKIKKYMNGGEIMSRYKADDYYRVGDDVEFMFDSKTNAQKLANDFNSNIISENDLFFVTLPKENLDKFAKGGILFKKLSKNEEEKDSQELKNKILFGKLNRELNKSAGRIHEEKFKKMINNENPNRISPVYVCGMRFEKCLFSPHYRIIK